MIGAGHQRVRGTSDHETAVRTRRPGIRNSRRRIELREAAAGQLPMSAPVGRLIPILVRRSPGRPCTASRPRPAAPRTSTSSRSPRYSRSAGSRCFRRPRLTAIGRLIDPARPIDPIRRRRIMRDRSPHRIGIPWLTPHSHHLIIGQSSIRRRPRMPPIVGPVHAVAQDRRIQRPQVSEPTTSRMFQFVPMFAIVDQ